jgi:hypothetical protein
MKTAILKGVTSLLVTLTIFLVMSGSAYLIYQLENLAFRAGNYVWSGVGDMFFWFLAVLESYIGLWVAFYALPKKLGFANFKLVYLDGFPREVDRYIMAILVGIPMGLAFSGIWKLLLLAFHIVF